MKLGRLWQWKSQGVVLVTSHRKQQLAAVISLLRTPAARLASLLLVSLLRVPLLLVLEVEMLLGAMKMLGERDALELDPIRLPALVGDGGR